MFAFAFTLLGSKVFRYFLFITVIISAITITYFTWKHSIEKQALLEFNNKQLEQTLKDQKIINDNLNKLNDDQKKIIDDLTTKNQQLINSLDNLNKYLNSDEAKKDDKKSSDILKKTIEELRKDQ